MKRHGTFRRIVGCLPVFPISSAFADGPQPQLAGPPIHIKAQRVAKISPDLQLLSPWYERDDGGAADHCGLTLAFDNFEPITDPNAPYPGFPTDGAANGGYDPNCGIGSQRWYFGPSYCNAYTVNDMTLADEDRDGEPDARFKGAPATRVEFAWHWDAEPCNEAALVAIFTAEGFNETCAGDPLNGETLYDGLIFDFGIITYCHYGFYYADERDLCHQGLSFQLPLDGRGAYIVYLLTRFAGDPTVLLPATCAQPMLWGTKQPNGTNPSYQGPLTWGDDLSNPGPHCDNFSYGVCPDPLGAAVCFYVEQQPPCDPVSNVQNPSGARFCDLGRPFTFSTSATGTPPLHYQWFHDTAPVGTDAPTYAIAAVGPGDLGSYRVVVSNDCGSIQSAPASLTLFAGRRGDANCDGVLDFFDIAPFVVALLNPEQYATQFPNCAADRDCVCDINHDGAVDVFDLTPFVQCLVNGGCP